MPKQENVLTMHLAESSDLWSESLTVLLNPELSSGNIVNYPMAETTGRLKIVCLFSVSFPFVGNPSTCSASHERFRTSRNDRNMELRQRPQGVIFIKIMVTRH